MGIYLIGMRGLSTVGICVNYEKAGRFLWKFISVLSRRGLIELCGNFFSKRRR